MPRSQISIHLGPCAEAALGTGTGIVTVEGKGGGGKALCVRWGEGGGFKRGPQFAVEREAWSGRRACEQRARLGEAGRART